MHLQPTVTKSHTLYKNTEPDVQETSTEADMFPFELCGSIWFLQLRDPHKTAAAASRRCLQLVCAGSTALLNIGSSACPLKRAAFSLNVFTFQTERWGNVFKKKNLSCSKSHAVFFFLNSFIFGCSSVSLWIKKLLMLFWWRGADPAPPWKLQRLTLRRLVNYDCRNYLFKSFQSLSAIVIWLCNGLKCRHPVLVPAQAFLQRAVSVHQPNTFVPGVLQVPRHAGPPYSAHDIAKGHPSLAGTPPGHAHSPALSQVSVPTASPYRYPKGWEAGGGVSL